MPLKTARARRARPAAAASAADEHLRDAFRPRKDEYCYPRTVTLPAAWRCGDAGVTTKTPVLATRYQAELFADATATTALASSKVKIIYVAKYTPVTETHRCRRPDCTSVVHVRVFLPAEAMRAERAKKIHPYFAVNLSPSHIPPPPSLLRLGAGHPRFTRIRKIAAGEYAFSITFTFRIGNDAAHWRFNFCTVDTVATDGLGLPGHHHCGATRIVAGIYYLG